MSNEVTVQLSLTVNKDELQWRSSAPGFNADMAGKKGPTPAAITVSTTGTVVDLSQLTTPGWVHLQNLDATNSVEWGIGDPQTDVFYPVGELGPGEGALFKFSRNLLEEYSPAAGTGTTGPTNTFRMRADTASCDVVVSCFEA